MNLEKKRHLVVMTSFSTSYTNAGRSLTEGLATGLQMRGKQTKTVFFGYDDMFDSESHHSTAVREIHDGLNQTEMTVVKIGTGNDVRLEQFIEVTCRKEGFQPDAIVLATTTRALIAIRNGLDSIIKRAEALVNVYGLPLIVVVNRRDNDDLSDLQTIEDRCLRMGINVIIAEHDDNGRDALAERVEQMCEEPQDFQFCTTPDDSITQKIETILRRLYHGRDVAYMETAKEGISYCEAAGNGQLPVCVVNARIGGRSIISAVDTSMEGGFINVLLDERPSNEEPMDDCRMTQRSCEDFIDVLASKAPVPGGGGASALVGALGMALGNMVGSLTLGKKKYAEVQDDIITLKKQADELQRRLLDLVEKDATVFKPLSKAYGLPSSTDEEKAYKAKVMENALDACCRVPLEIMKTVCEAIELLQVFGAKGTAIAISDVGVGVVCCKAALQGASLNVFINTKSMMDREKAECINKEAETMLVRYIELADTVFSDVRTRFN